MQIQTLQFKIEKNKQSEPKKLLYIISKQYMGKGGHKYKLYRLLL